MSGVGKAGNTSHYGGGVKKYQSGKKGRRNPSSRSSKRIKRRLWASLKEFYTDGKAIPDVEIRDKKK